MKKLSDFYISMPVKNKKGSSKILSVFMTLFVAGLLVIAGPVDALFLGLDGFKNTPYTFGENVNFIGKIDINSNERVDIQNVSIEVNDVIVCTFDVSGSLLTSCDGVNVSLISNTANHGYGYGYSNFSLGWNGGNRSSNAGNWTGNGYGYGYGYSGAGELVYNISIETPQSYFRIPGNNEIKLISNTETQTFNSRTEHIVLQNQNSGGGNGGGNNGGNGNRGGEEGGRRNNNNWSNLSNKISKGLDTDILTNPVQDDVETLFGLDDENADSSNGITGSVIGISGKNWIIISGTVLFVVIALAVSFAVYRRKSLKHYNSLY